MSLMVNAVLACPPIPTSTPIPPTSTPVPPTNTPIPPTSTMIPPTNTSIPPTSVPECKSVETGRVVHVLYMNNTDPLHFGYWDLNGIKIGVCRIETNTGQFPNRAFVQTFCSCGIPNFTWITDRSDLLTIVKNCNGTLSFKYTSSSVYTRGWEFGKYCPASKCATRN